MNVGRIFANAVARRVAYVLVALVLAWFGLGDARAQTYPNCTAEYEGSATCADRETAYLSAKAAAEYRCGLTSNCHSVSDIPQMMPPTSGNLGGVYFGYKWGPGGAFNSNGPTRYWVTECPAGQEWHEAEKKCIGNDCPNKPPLSGGLVRSVGLDGLPESHPNSCPLSTCSAGCEYQDQGTNNSYYVIDGVAWCSVQGWAPSGQQCSASPSMPEPGTPPTDSDGDGTSDEYDLSPNNPGESGDGSGQDVSRACGGPGQPECLPDGSNEGSGRGNTSGGGGDCNTPPRSSGDAILAQIAFQTWATRCAIQGAANAGAGTGSGSGDGGEGALDQLRAEAAGLDTSLGEGDADAAWIEGPTMLDLDTGGLGIGGTCPAPPTINGVSIDPDGNLCMLVQIIGALVLVGAYVHAGYIIGRS